MNPLLVVGPVVRSDDGDDDREGRERVGTGVVVVGDEAAECDRCVCSAGSLTSMLNARAMLLAPAAVLAGDAMLPLFVHRHGPVAHSALHGHGWAPLTMAVIGLLGLAGLAWAVADHRRGARLDLRSLLAMQTVGHVTLEAWSAGSVTMAASGPLWLGLAVQLLLAGVVVALVRAGGAVVERLIPRRWSLLSFARLRVPRSTYSAGRPHVPFVRLRDVRGPPAVPRPMLVR
jgi:hypothetical protein